MGKIYHKEIPKNKRKQSLPPPRPTIEKVEDNPVPSLNNYKKIVKYINKFDTIEQVDKILIEDYIKKLQNGVETNKEQPKYDLNKWFNDQKNIEYPLIRTNCSYNNCTTIQLHGFEIILLENGTYILNDTTG